jgi:hypothetical protein
MMHTMGSSPGATVRGYSNDALSAAVTATAVAVAAAAVIVAAAAVAAAAAAVVAGVATSVEPWCSRCYLIQHCCAMSRGNLT